MKLIKFNKSNLDNCICMFDFYKSVNMLELFTPGKTSVSQIFANKKMLDLILESIKSNVKKSKDKRVKSFKKAYRDTIVSMDWLFYAPTLDNSLEDFTIGFEYDKQD